MPIKTVGQWVLRGKVGTATGFFNAGTNTWIIVAALAVPLVVTESYWGWPAAFYLTVVCCGWPFWLLIYDAPRVSPAELAFIRSDRPDRGRSSACSATANQGLHPDNDAHRARAYVLPVLERQIQEQPRHRTGAEVFWPLVLYRLADAWSGTSGRSVRCQRERGP